MKIRIQLFAVLIFTLICSDVLSIEESRVTNDFVAMCYVTSWAQYRQGIGKFTVEDIDPTLCTHVIYAFATVDDDLHIAAAEWNDMSTTWSVGNYEKLQRLKDINPRLHIILSVGGYTLGTKKFTEISSTEELRADFIQHGITFLRDHGFDGLQIDWTYPTFGDSPPEDRQRYTLLLEDFEIAFRKESELPGRRRLILIASVAGEKYYEQAYEFDRVSRAVDYLTVRSHDLHDPKEPYAFHQSPLYPAPGDFYGEHETTESVISIWIDNGALYSKIILGMSTFARTYTLANSTESYVRAPIIGKGDAGPIVDELGLLAYYEVCMTVNASDVYLDEEQVATYAVSGDQWISFDNKENIQTKIDWVKQNGFAGIALWSMALDDFTGISCQEGRYPLIRTAVDTLYSGSMALRNGYSEREGIIIMRVNGTYGYICDEEWTQNDADVACRQLGYADAEPIESTKIVDMTADYSVLMQDIRCDGSEKRLDECAWSTKVKNDTCLFVSVRCTEDVRLVKTENMNYPTLEIYWNSNWIQVCSSEWNSVNADVVCKMFGYAGSVPDDCCSTNQIQENTIYVTDVICDGNEDHIKSCSYFISNKCVSDSVVGINCIKDRCDKGWVFIEGRCVLISIRREGLMPLNWSDSMQYCNSVGADLMTIRNEDDLREINHQIVDFWIGLNDDVDEGVFRWEDGTVNSYSNWLSGEPNNLGCNRNCLDANCVAMEKNTGLWTDERCSRKSLFICKTKNSQLLVCEPKWKYFNGSCYRQFKHELSWQEARRFCNQRNATLASIMNSDEQTWLIELLNFPTSINFWTAINDIEEEGVYKGIGGVAAEYLNWDVDQPDQKGDCITFTTSVGGVMHDRDCAKQYPWLCEKQISYRMVISEQPTTPTSSSSTTAVVVSVCSVAFGLLLVFIIIVIIIIKRSKRTKLRELLHKSTKHAETHEYLPQPIIEPADEFKNMELPRNRIVIKKKIGGGEFGKVMLGHVVGIESAETVKVAIKCLRDHSASKDDFLDEIRLLLELGKHQNIIALVGCVTISQPYMALFEFMPYGDLLQFLRKAREVKNGGEAEDPIYDLSLADQLNISRQIANGMNFVSSLKYYHGDLAARNILVGENLIVKICDFGLAADIYQKGYDRMAPDQKRPFKWSSLETLTEGICTIKSDVWSYGVVLYEVFTLGAVPYPHSDAHTLIEQLKAGTRLPKPKDCPDEIYSLMLTCWLENPADRPYFDELSKDFTKLLETCNQPEGYLDLNEHSNNEEVDKKVEDSNNEEDLDKDGYTLALPSDNNIAVRYVNDKIRR